MALDREKILQTAQKYASKKKYDRAIAEYQKIVQEDPNDARTLLKIGDLQARMEAFAEAIATYDRVGRFYSSQGFSLKAIAVYKQIRELIRKHAPQLADRYAHIMPKLADIYSELGLTSDALAAYDEVATGLQKRGRDRDAIDIFRKMVALDSTNPLPHLRLAEACCRVQSVDEAIDSFWTAAELLIRLDRRDDALKVIERILHFKQDPKHAKVAAELYLERGTREDGLQALAKLQLCFQANPKDLEVLELLARSFLLIEQEAKAVEVRKEMASIAQEEGKTELFRELVDKLVLAAPNDERVQELARAAPRTAEVVEEPSASVVSVDDVELMESTVESEPAPVLALSDDVEIEEIDFDEQPVHRPALASSPDVVVEELDEIEEVSGEPVAPRPFMASAPEVVVVDDDIHAAEELIAADSVEADAHARKAVVDAESFRGLRLYSKAIETLNIALEIEPRSISIRDKLREVLWEAGDRDGAIGEMITLAAIHMDSGETHKAEAMLYQVLEQVPDHATACEMLEQLGGFAAAGAPHYGEGAVPYTDEPYTTTEDFTDPHPGPDSLAEPYDAEAPLPSYDLEEIPAARAMAPREAADSLDVDDPFELSAGQDVPLPSFPLQHDDDLDAHLEGERTGYAPGDVDAIDPSIPGASNVPDFGAPQSGTEAIEEALDEAEFFFSRGLYDDAKMILTDQLQRTPNHPLLLERLAEIEQSVSAAAHESGTRDRTDLELEDLEDEHVFDIAASLDALDELEVRTRSSRPPPAIKPTDEVDVDQVFEKFKAGVRSQVSESDSSTHYDLGVAYKEMGLLPDAINEFEIAARDPKFQCMCWAMIGMIQLEQGNLDAAADAYVNGLGAAQKTIDQEMSLYYDLGNVYEMKGSSSEALYYFQKIARRDPGFRDVRDRIDALSPSAKKQSSPRAVNSDDDFDAAFDDLFESK